MFIRMNDVTCQGWNDDLRIDFVFSRIILSNFFVNSANQNFPSVGKNSCLQGNQEVSVYTSDSIIRFYLTPKNVELYTIFLHWIAQIAFWPQIPNGRAYSLLLTRLSPITSEKITRTLLTSRHSIIIQHFVTS